MNLVFLGQRAFSQSLEPFVSALKSSEPVTVLVKMGKPMNLKQTQSPNELATLLQDHLEKEISKEAPWLKGGQAEGIEELVPLWIVGAVKVRARPAALEKLLMVKKAHSLSIERAKPIHNLFDSETPGTLPSGSSSVSAESMGWGVQKIRAPEAWKLGASGEGVVVAVLDSGVNIRHPDLESNIWMNAGETGTDSQGQDKSSNGLDDDGNGYVDDLYGWNFEENSNDISDYLGHGTQAAGIIAGQGKKGVQTGVAPKAKVMALRSCCLLGGEVAESAIWEALQYAMKQGARVVSMSVSMKHWGKPNYVFWRRASEVLNSAGIVHVNSAGNRGKGNEPFNIGAPGSNPPAWLHPLQSQDASNLSSMITVGAVDFDDQVRPYSSVGPVTWEEVPEYGDFQYANGKKAGLLKPDICAPSETPSLSFDGLNYTPSFGGTSSATPHVAGAVAVLLSGNPKLSVAQITESLQMSTVPVEGEFTNQCGSGRLDLLSAVEYSRRQFSH